MYIGIGTFIENNDVAIIYLYVNGSLKHFNAFKEKIRGIASFYKGRLVYKDEEKLLEAFKKNFKEFFSRREFNTLNELIAVINLKND